MKVSMIPNDDIVTIHASQNDGDKRIWEFEPYTNDGVIDTLGSQTIYPVYAGGTEQILPVNESVPVTSPIIADIEYPDELRTDQEFLYRQVPSVSGGNAKIQTIYGNTIVWNEQVQNGNLVDSTGWTAGTVESFTIGDGKATLVLNANAASVFRNGVSSTKVVSGHKYLVCFDITSTFATTNTLARFYRNNVMDQSFDSISLVANQKTRYAKTLTAEASGNVALYLQPNRNVASTGTVVYENINLFDLTQMGLDTLTANEFISLFPLSYYAYDAGRLLPFKGTGIKTADLNQVEHTTSLPVLSYFPDGMKSAGLVYDELNGSKAITRIGAVDMWSLTWTYNSSNAFFSAAVAGGRTDLQTGDMPNILAPIYTAVTARTGAQFAAAPDMSMTWGRGSSNVYVKNTSYTDADTFKTAMSGVYLYYELATPTEEEFTTMSLVSQNVEIPLEKDGDKIICKCSELITQTPGFHDCKLKLTDSDGTIYSSKFKLHVERKP